MENFDFCKLDDQIVRFRERLINDLGIDPSCCSRFASTLATDVSLLPISAQKSLSAEDGPIRLSERFDEIIAFQSFMEFAHDFRTAPQIVRTQVIVQNYVCFVYLGDALFKKLKDAASPNSSLYLCSSFLTSDPIKAFRNALAHASWRYAPDFQSLQFWDLLRKKKEEQGMRSVQNDELAFWQMLARVTAYVVITMFSKNR